MKYKAIIKQVTIFWVTLILCVLALIGTALIPKESIQNQIEESAEFYKTVKGIERIQSKREYSYVYYASDSILLNILYCIDTTHPFSSVMQAQYYQRIAMDINDNFIELVEKNPKPNMEYMRYWHGSMTILRPLLTCFSIEEIYQINTVFMWLLMIGLLFILARIE